MGAVSSTGIASETGELEKRSGTDLPSATLNSYLEAAFPVSDKKIMSDMPHTEIHLDVKQEKDSCIVPGREPSNSPKQNPETTNHASFSDKASPVATQEQFESLEKDLDIMMQIPHSDLVIPSQESKPPVESHVMGDLSRTPKDELTDFHLSQSADVGVKISSICDGEKTTEKTEMVEGTPLPAQSIDGAPASQPNEQMVTKSSQTGKALEKLHPRRNPDAGGCSSQPDQVTVTSSDSIIDSGLTNEETHPDDARNQSLISKEEKVSNTKAESVSQNFVQTPTLSIGESVPQPGQESYKYSTMFEKVEKLQPRRNLDFVVQESKSDVGSTPSKTPDKGLDDGYNWRKYGQKLVKGNKFVRSYYKCTYPNCQAKKQVERSHDGCKSDINYLGNHHHQKSQQSPQATSIHQVRTPETPIASTSKTNAEVMTKDASLNQHMRPTVTSPQSTVGRSADGLSGADSSSNYNTTDLHDCPDAKRQKRDPSSIDDGVVNRSSSDSQHVVQTLSEVDLVNDGYRWRKYGQKLVKGNPNPRSYYRCSTAGCPVKKHVERASHDSKLVITTYEGKHDHGIPTSRTVSQSTARDDTKMIITNDEPSSKPEDKGPVSLERVVHVSAN